MNTAAAAAAFWAFAPARRRRRRRRYTFCRRRSSYNSKCFFTLSLDYCCCSKFASVRVFTDTFVVYPQAEDFSFGFLFQRFLFSRCFSTSTSNL
uniref:Secreted protein n=1 Tax=Syphacia muris TaxID=451379 RepID=A0A0N5AZN1_9BILA